MVGLGFSVDNASFDQMNKAVDSAGEGITSFASTAVKAFGKAALSLAAFGVAATAATAKFLGGLGDQEIQMQILSRQLWTTQQQAMAFNATLKAMGTNLQDLYLSPTLMQQYTQLEKVAQQMSTPADYNQVISQVQNISLQLKQMKLEAYYALQWIGYYFIKYMQGPISNVHNVLQSINDVIVKNMPTWTKQVAQVMASFMQAGIQIVKAMEQVYNWFVKFDQEIPGWATGVAAGIALISLAMNSNPLIRFMTILSSAILLLNDFETYLKDPTKSAFPQFWAWVVKITNAVQGMGLQKTAINDLNDALSTVGKTFKSVGRFATNLYNTFQKNGTIKTFRQDLVNLLQASDNLGQSIGNLISSIGDLFGKLNNTQNQSNMINFWQLVADTLNGFIQSVTLAIDGLSYLTDAVSDVLKGKWSEAANVLNFLMGNGANLSTLPGYNAGSGSSGTSASVFYTTPSYVYNTPNTTTVKHITVNANQTNHVTGSANPHATSNAIGKGYNKTLHNIKGIIQ